MKKIISLFLTCSILFGLLTGCDKDGEDESYILPRLMVEARGGSHYGGMGGYLVTLPVSGTTVALQKEPLVSEFEIVNVEMVKVEMGLALLVQTSDKGARDLYRGSVSNMGGRIVLTVNGNAIGARRIDGAIQDGNFYTFVEVDDAELGQLVIELKESLVKIAKAKNR